MKANANFGFKAGWRLGMLTNNTILCTICGQPSGHWRHWPGVYFSDYYGPNVRKVELTEFHTYSPAKSLLEELQVWERTCTGCAFCSPPKSRWLRLLDKAKAVIGVK
jgi:hypothetical protein